MATGTTLGPSQRQQQLRGGAGEAEGEPTFGSLGMRCQMPPSANTMQPPPNPNGSKPAGANSGAAGASSALVPLGGQRAALKLGPRPLKPPAATSSAAAQQQQQQQQAAAWQPQQPPAAPLTRAQAGGSCFAPDSPSLATGGLCSSSIECSIAEPGAQQPHEGPAGVALLADNFSDCSCCSNNSLDCLTDPLTQSSSQLEQLDQPLLAHTQPAAPNQVLLARADYQQPAGPGQPPAQQQQHQHHPRQANDPGQHHLSHQQHHHHHHHHHQQHQHQQLQGHHNNGQQQHHHHHHHHQRHILHLDGADCQQPYARTGLSQPAMRQQQFRQPMNSVPLHRPIHPHASMPPLSGAGSSSPPPGPPPLIRHSTYTASSSTITDANFMGRASAAPAYNQAGPDYAAGCRSSSPALNEPPRGLPAASQQHHHRHRHHQQQPLSASDFIPPNNSSTNYYPNDSNQQANVINSNRQQQQRKAPLGGGGGGGGGTGESSLNEQHQLKSTAVSFKRSATTRAPDGRWHEPKNIYTGNHSSHQQANANNYHPSLERKCNRQSSGEGGSNSLQRQRSNNADDPIRSNSTNTTTSATRNNNNNSGSQRQRTGETGLQSTQTVAASLDASQSMPTGVRQSANIMIPGQPPAGYYPNSAPAAMAALGAGSRAHHQLPLGQGPFEAAAFCPLPAITSHRTNSPWMRLSSFILTPIGIVIILFIVVSPLLHYLM